MLRKMDHIKIEETVLLDMREHARREYPLECCGLLWGQGKVVEGLFGATNEKASRTEFQIPAPELIAFMKSIRAKSKEFLGIYHSHPEGPACPSRRDAEEFHYREVSYWIVSLQHGRSEVRCYRWARDQFLETPYQVHQPGGRGRD